MYILIYVHCEVIATINLTHSSPHIVIYMAFLFWYGEKSYISNVLFINLPNKVHCFMWLSCHFKLPSNIFLKLLCIS